LIPLKYNPQQIILVGDPCQLPATVFSRIARNGNYEQSLFQVGAISVCEAVLLLNVYVIIQRLCLSGHPVFMLEVQYRMHRHIAEYPSQRFYHGRLATYHNSPEDSVECRPEYLKPFHRDPSRMFGPLVIHNLFSSRELKDGVSIANYEEVLALDVIRTLLGFTVCFYLAFIRRITLLTCISLFVNAMETVSISAPSE
jgi:senataxin